MPTMKKKSSATGAQPASKLITERIAELGDWRGKTLATMRALIKKADPDIVEEWKWGVPVWSHDGIVCTGETYKSVVKLTFAKGAALKDPKRLFNSSLEGNTRRAIDIREGEKPNAAAFTSLVREAVALNIDGGGKTKSAKPAKSAKSAKPSKKAKRPVTVDEYIAAAPVEGQPHLKKLFALLKDVAPKAEPVLKWGNPFFVEPRFVFAFSAHSKHLSFAPSAATMTAFDEELAKQDRTKHFLKVPYDKPLPEALIRKMGKHSVKTVAARTDDGFW